MKYFKLDPVIKKSLAKIVELVLCDGAKKATRYYAENYTVKATLKGKPRKNERQREILLTIGRPNYAERDFISKCKKAGEPFPVRKVQIKWA